MALMPPALPDSVQRSPSDMIREFSGQIEALLSQNILASVDQEKTWQYLTLRRNYLYLKGVQSISPTIQDGFVDYQPVSGSSGLGVHSDGFEDSPYDYVINVYRGDIRKFTAILGQRAPNVEAGPRTENNEEQIARSKKAQLAAKYLFDTWDASLRQGDLAFSLAIGGTTFGYVDYVTDRNRFGTSQVPKLEDRTFPVIPPSFDCPGCGASGDIDQMDVVSVPPGEEVPGMGLCPECGEDTAINPAEMMTAQIPSETEFDTFDNGGVDLKIENGLRVITPFYTRDLASSPWLLYQYEEDWGRLLQAYPELRDPAFLQSIGWNYDLQGRTAREQIASMSGTTYTYTADRKLFSRFWLRPSMYEYFIDEDLRNQMRESFPAGVKITAVDGFLVRLESQSIEECWTVCQPERDEYLWRPGYLDDMIQAVDVINDFWNITIETQERAIPLNLVNPRVIDPEQLNRRGRNVGEAMAANAGYTGDFRNAIYSFAATKPEPMASNLAGALLETYQNGVTGMLPSLFGASDASTAREAELNRNQALQVLSTPWNNMRNFWEQVTTLGVRQLAKHSTGELFRSDGTSEMALRIENIQELELGGFKFKAEENFPMTPGQLRDRLVELADSNNPEVPQRLGLWAPANANLLASAIGIPDWTFPEADSRNRLLGIVNQLLQQQPEEIMNPITGQPEQVSSIAPSDLLFVPEFAVDALGEWMRSEEGAEAEQSNPIGYLNVMVYADGYRKMIAPEPLPGEEGAPEGEGSADAAEEGGPA